MGCDGLGGERPNDKSWGRDQRGRLSIPRYLSEEEIAKSDEYSEGDPYSVEDRLDSPFHRRRFNLTLELLRDVAPFKHLLDVDAAKDTSPRKSRNASPKPKSMLWIIQSQPFAKPTGNIQAFISL